jgi:medium-chain acyl-[acyl-carrier-protein] hydrolase
MPPERWLTAAAMIQASATLFCLPHAGGGASAFLPWRPKMPSVAIVPALLAGREWRALDRPQSSVAEVVGELAEAIIPLIHRRYALLGHSYGALLAFELARALRRVGAPAASVLYVCSARAPHIRAKSPALSGLPADALLAAVHARFGAMSDAVLKDDELRDYVVRLLRADLTAFESYEPADEPPLDCPIIVASGSADTTVDATELGEWRRHTSSGCVLRVYPGDHFFLKYEATSLLQDIQRDLGRVVDAEQAAR